MMGPGGILVPREVASESFEAEGSVPISHPTGQTRELLADPSLEEEEEEEEEESDLEEDIRGGWKAVEERAGKEVGRVTRERTREG